MELSNFLGICTDGAPSKIAYVYKNVMMSVILWHVHELYLQNELVNYRCTTLQPNLI
jgi:hypothetical protein